jgi:hypothetical protein
MGRACVLLLNVRITFEESSASVREEREHKTLLRVPTSAK